MPTRFYIINICGFFIGLGILIFLIWNRWKLNKIREEERRDKQGGHLVTVSCSKCGLPMDIDRGALGFFYDCGMQCNRHARKRMEE